MNTIICIKIKPFLIKWIPILYVYNNSIMQHDRLQNLNVLILHCTRIPSDLISYCIIVVSKCIMSKTFFFNTLVPQYPLESEDKTSKLF